MATSRSGCAGITGFWRAETGRDLQVALVDPRAGRVVVLIAMAGLPGCGKTALAQRLAERLKAVVLDKDTIRAALFPAAAG